MCLFQEYEWSFFDEQFASGPPRSSLGTSRNSPNDSGSSDDIQANLPAGDGADARVLLPRASSMTSADVANVHAFDNALDVLAPGASMAAEEEASRVVLKEGYLIKKPVDFLAEHF